MPSKSTTPGRSPSPFSEAQNPDPLSLSLPARVPRRRRRRGQLRPELRRLVLGDERSGQPLLLARLRQRLEFVPLCVSGLPPSRGWRRTALTMRGFLARLLDLQTRTTTAATTTRTRTARPVRDQLLLSHPSAPESNLLPSVQLLSEPHDAIQRADPSPHRPQRRQRRRDLHVVERLGLDDQVRSGVVDASGVSRRARTSRDSRLVTDAVGSMIRQKEVSLSALSAKPGARGVKMKSLNIASEKKKATAGCGAIFPGRTLGR